MSAKKPLCVVTGGAGFIGSNLVDGLRAKGFRVRVFDNLSTGFESNLSHHRSGVDLIRGDIRKEAALVRAFRGADYVFHMAAIRAVLRSVDNPTETHEVNGTGTLNVLLAARKTKVKRVIYTSSSAIYGDVKHYPTRETDLPKPESPYGACKLLGEHYCRFFTDTYGLSTVSLRYFNVFGPRQNPESKYSAVIPIFIECLLKNKRPEVHWDGKQSRDFNYVDNIVHANILSMCNPKAHGQVFNVATNEELSVLDILEAIQKVMRRRDLKPIFAPKRKGDVRRTFADISRLRRDLGFRVQTRFAAGLEKTVHWFLKERIK
jgi:nucleoside-diphosphate-sugar epimerase